MTYMTNIWVTKLLNASPFWIWTRHTFDKPKQPKSSSHPRVSPSYLDQELNLVSLVMGKKYDLSLINKTRKCCPILDLNQTYFLINLSGQKVARTQEYLHLILTKNWAWSLSSIGQVNMTSATRLSNADPFWIWTRDIFARTIMDYRQT